MPEKSPLNLENILGKERDERKKRKLVSLEDDFYRKVAAQIQDLEREKKKISDTYSTKFAIVEDEQKTEKNAIESIINNRTTKIINEARHDVEMSFHETSKNNEKPNLESMTGEEKIFYNRLFEVMKEWKSEINKIFRMESARAAPTTLPEEDKKPDIIPEDKKDISKEYIVVRLLTDIPTFVGVDGRNYTLAKEDVVVLSTVNAKALINRKAANQIKVKK